jgi:hypothetical protein
VCSSDLYPIIQVKAFHVLGEIYPWMRPECDRYRKDFVRLSMSDEAFDQLLMA